MRQKILIYFFTLMLTFIQQINVFAVKDFRFINNQKVINEIKSMINLEEATCDIDWRNLIPPLEDVPKEFIECINSGRKMSEVFHVDYSKIIFGTFNKSENIILILVPVLYKDNNITGEIVFKCRIENSEELKNSSIQEALSSEKFSLKFSVLNNPTITVFDNTGYKEWNPSRYDDFKTLEKKLRNGAFRKDASGIYILLPKVYMKEKFEEEDKFYYNFEALPGACGCEDSGGSEDSEGSEDNNRDSDGRIDYEYGCFLKIEKNDKNFTKSVWMELFSHLDTDNFI